MSSKNEKIINISLHILRKDVLSGHLKWKVTELAKAAKASRSVIYELFGRNKKEMLLTALIHTLEELYSLSPERIEQRKSAGPYETLLKSRKLVIENPELLAFYFRHRERPDLFGQKILYYEKKISGFSC